MKAIVATTDEKMYVKEFTGGVFEAAEKEVGGFAEYVHPRRLPAPYCMFVNEDGLLMNLPQNLRGSFCYMTAGHGHPIVGNIVIMKDAFVDGEPSIVGLDDEDVEYLVKLIDTISDGTIEREEDR